MNSIQRYILENEKAKALDFLQNFSALMREVLDNSSRPYVSLDEEISMLGKYMHLERLRLDELFDYRIEIAPDLQTDFFEIPGMIIQPYVENAIWHGLMHKNAGGLLTVKFDRTNGALNCTVEDNGVGRARASELQRQKSPHRKGYGTILAQRRLELLNQNTSDAPDVSIHDLYDPSGQPSGTRIKIRFHLEN
jgi:LytS/YehU family sensor histidine kinase